MGEWLLSRDRLSSQARSAWMLQFGHLERGTPGDLCPKVATGLSPGLKPRVETQG